jgi:hypothetical protein
MVTRISKSREIIRKLEADGHKKNIDSEKYSRVSTELDEKMKIVRREYKQKESESQKFASVVTLTS